MDIYFPRRGSFIIQYDEFNKRYLTDLEPYYDNFPKIFLKYISETIIFGYTKESYYATSDTYFLWPNNIQDDLDYLFFIAYLNSKLVKFLFRAKNFIIKRSKTNWENLPIPNLQEFQQKEDIQIINLIKFFTSMTIQEQTGTEKKELIEKSLHFNQYKKCMNPEFVSQFEAIIEKTDFKSIQKIIDFLFFQLFRLDEKLIDDLLKKFYNF
jgi:hypothetical protein